MNVGDWLIAFPSAQRVLIDVVLKTGALLLRPQYLEKLKGVASVQRVRFGVRSPRGVEKLASNYVVVEIQHEGTAVRSITGLFEYAYGALRLVAIDDKDLAEQAGNEIVAFFEAPLMESSRGFQIEVFESAGKSR